MNETRVVKDLSIGDTIQVKGFDDPLVVRSAKKVLKGTDAGKLDVKLAGPDGSIETVRFDPEEAVVVVGKDEDRSQQPQKAAGKGKGKAASKGKASAGNQKNPTGKGKGKGKTPEAPAEESTSAEVPTTPDGQPEPAVTDALVVDATQAEVTPTEAPVVEAPQAERGTPEPAPADAVPAETTPPAEPTPTDTPTPETTSQDAKPRRTRGKKAQPHPDGQPAKLSAIDAAAKVLGETGQPMNCPEMIGAMAAQGYWSSPAGKTPAGTLYSAILREVQVRGDDARFVKAARGKFALRTAHGKELT
jgi:hypothetical protein